MEKKNNRKNETEEEEKDSVYFGESGRNDFYQRCQWLKQQGEIVSAQSKDSVSNAYFDSKKDRLVFSRKGWNGQKKIYIRRGGMLEGGGYDDDVTVGTLQTHDSMSSMNSTCYTNNTNNANKHNSNSNNHSIYSHSNSSNSNSKNAKNNIPSISIPRNIYINDLKLLSPRTRFISSCMREGLNPRASLLIRKSLTNKLKLPHMSMGDQMADLLAQSLCDLTDIEAIDLKDNILTDVSLEPLIRSICHIPKLQVLNFSNNTIGHISAKAMSDYLSMPLCPLKRLILNDANIGDYECEYIITSIKVSFSVVLVDGYS